VRAKNRLKAVFVPGAFRPTPASTTRRDAHGGLPNCRGRNGNWPSYWGWSWTSSSLCSPRQRSGWSPRPRGAAPDVPWAAGYGETSRRWGGGGDVRGRRLSWDTGIIVTSGGRPRSLRGTRPSLNARYAAAAPTIKATAISCNPNGGTTVTCEPEPESQPEAERQAMTETAAEVDRDAQRGASRGHRHPPQAPGAPPQPRALPTWKTIVAAP
jgi:hypothetical protein